MNMKSNDDHSYCSVNTKLRPTVIEKTKTLLHMLNQNSMIINEDTFWNTIYVYIPVGKFAGRKAVEAAVLQKLTA